MFELEAEPPRAQLISLTPLIDVVFILLIFFMLASSFLDWRAVDLKIATPSSAPAGQVNSLVVRISSDGAIDLAGRRVTIDDMAGQVEERLSAQPDLRILIAPESGVALQSAVDVLQRLKQIGAANVSLIGKRPSQ